MYIPDEANDKLVNVDREFVLENDKQLSLDGWTYRYPELLKSGRLTNTGFSETAQEQLVEKDPEPPRLRPIDEPEPSSWALRLFSQNATVSQKTGSELATVQLTHAVITNKKWPGLINFFDEETKAYGLVYFGYGLKKDQLVLPLLSSLVEIEPKFKENREHKEPNPDNDDDVLETDSEPEVDENDA